MQNYCKLRMVKPKKYLGQHFLKDKNIAKKIVDALGKVDMTYVLEVGAGTGVLTEFLLKKQLDIYVIEIDSESVVFLGRKFPELENRIFEKDFLKFDFSFFNNEIAVIGNFPYNISTQIVFKIIENKDIVTKAVGMFQKEVAERIAAKPGNKTYGILSVLTQAFYDTEYLFTVSENVFYPPPKVKSGVIRLTRKDNYKLACDEKLFKQIIKASFNQRRKIMRNSLKSITSNFDIEDEILKCRPEQLGVEDFIRLTNLIFNEIKNQKG